MTYHFSILKRIFLVFISLLLLGTVNAQTEEELDELMEEMDIDTVKSITGEGVVYNKLDVPPTPRTSMTNFYGVVNRYIKEYYPEGENKFGRINVEFVVEIDGNLTNFKVQGGLNENFKQDCY